MQLKALLADEDAVSPVIGVILMVAITVILAAVIGTFVLGLGDQVSNTTPQVSFTFDFDSSVDGNTGVDCSQLVQGNDANDGELSITHDGGDQVNEDRLTLRDDDGNSVTDIGTSCDGIADGSDVSAGTTIKAGIDSGDIVRVIWTAQGGGDSGTLGKFSGPDA